MIAEEKYLEDKYGKKQPFKVPNGYFDSFAESLMDKLPEQQPVMTPHISMWRKWRKLRLTVAVAASVCAVMFSVMTFMHNTKPTHSPLASNHTTKTVTNDSYNTLDVAADYTMLDNDDIYVLVSGIQ
mgnify:FL=1